jgi:hypothetical protein
VHTVCAFLATAVVSDGALAVFALDAASVGAGWPGACGCVGAAGAGSAEAALSATTATFDASWRPHAASICTAHASATLCATRFTRRKLPWFTRGTFMFRCAQRQARPRDDASALGEALTGRRASTNMMRMQLRVALGALFLTFASGSVGCGSDSAMPSPAGGGQAGSSAGAPSSAGSAGASAASGSGGASGSTGSGGIAAAPNLDPTIRLKALTMNQKAILCDWFDGEFGGYGVTNPCPGGGTVASVANYSNQAQCVSIGLKFQCDGATVGYLEACTVAQLPSLGCDTPSPACDPLYCITPP